MVNFADRLGRTDAEYAVTTLPDGSVDAYCEVRTPRGDPIGSWEAFAEAIAASRTASFALERTAVEPGGHAVHAAAQADSLGADATCYGHLDDAAFADLPFETASMGRPARLRVCEFDDGDVILRKSSGDRDGWTLDALRDAAGGAFRDALTADAVVCANWATFDGMTDALTALADRDLDGDRFVFDASEIGARDADAIGRTCDALGALAASYDVTLTGNREEFDAVAAALGTGGESGADTLAAVRESVGVGAAVLHGKSVAVAAHRDGVTTVPNFTVDDPVRRTGAGDHFVGGMVHGLACGWDWEPTLRLANACASHYVATARTGTPGDLRSFVGGSGE